MTGLDTPALARPQNRGVSPIAQMGDPLLEVIQQPLYSALAVDAAVIPNETRFFQYQQGDTVPGAGAGALVSSLYHTNMETAGALATPKVFEVWGIRLVMSNISAAGTAAPAQPAVPAAATDAAMHDDMMRLFWGTHFTLHVGTKDYQSLPSFLVPGNCGLSGYAAAGMDDGAAPEQIIVQAVQGGGKPMDVRPFTIFIPAQQSFYAQLRAPQTTPPTLAVARLLWCMLEGRLGREAQ